MLHKCDYDDLQVRLLYERVSKQKRPIMAHLDDPVIVYIPLIRLMVMMKMVMVMMLVMMVMMIVKMVMMLMLVMMVMNIISIFSVTRRYRSDVCYLLSE